VIQSRRGQYRDVATATSLEVAQHYRHEFVETNMDLTVSVLEGGGRDSGMSVRTQETN